MWCWLSSIHTSAHLFCFSRQEDGMNTGPSNFEDDVKKKKLLLFSAFANELPNSACVYVCFSRYYFLSTMRDKPKWDMDIWMCYLNLRSSLWTCGHRTHYWCSSHWRDLRAAFWETFKTKISKSCVLWRAAHYWHLKFPPFPHS